MWPTLYTLCVSVMRSEWSDLHLKWSENVYWAVVITGPVGPAHLHVYSLLYKSILSKSLQMHTDTQYTWLYMCIIILVHVYVFNRTKPHHTLRVNYWSKIPKLFYQNGESISLLYIVISYNIMPRKKIISQEKNHYMS